MMQAPDLFSQHCLIGHSSNALTAGEVTEERLKSRSSALNALCRFRSASLDDKKPSNPCKIAS